MKKLKGLLGSGIAAVYFIFPMCFILILLAIMPFVFFITVSITIKSGFSITNMASTNVVFCGFFIGLSLLIPVLRKMYHVLPWLYSFIKIFFIDLVIINIGIMIMNAGYQIGNTTRHIIFTILMIVQILVCRIGMCIYFKLNPAKYIEER
ncbi:hypothetical protein SAMN02745163_03811 [Clostridium cavendishii DSM 21758]|uniref:Uncharacterized protein n=1 Tax=Clostridium cavendishii DSM 21758 TaxID=1121302 RepID=A0A1M6SHJ7_9CLOT|nr:hypothetical protein [Clostridium cavendishii]SHK44130.1 hypothetical protein SAMN02745163_03811 [Clostridium cavendishii DSM 21758]